MLNTIKFHPLTQKFSIQKANNKPPIHESINSSNQISSKDYLVIKVHPFDDRVPVPSQNYSTADYITIRSHENRGLIAMEKYISAADKYELSRKQSLIKALGLNIPIHKLKSLGEERIHQLLELINSFREIKNGIKSENRYENQVSKETINEFKRARHNLESALKEIKKEFRLNWFWWPRHVFQ
ncbi:MAG: hypothetical protein QNJ31_05620 [Candidatus Caenarcaniphilales bacterium]|nr:hypothetical protein [Candidatus Caenarcaniphilales bacterium]